MMAISLCIINYNGANKMSETMVSIKLHDDKKIAPRYKKEETIQLQCHTVVITEKGTDSDLPLIDFQMIGPDGKQYFFAMTGRIVNGIASAIRGVNMRNHGVEEP